MKELMISKKNESHKRILITGANSYIGTSFATYASVHYSELDIDTIDMINGSWRDKFFGDYDTVFHVAGIAHADVGHVDEETKAKYYAINTDLAIETARRAKADGVNQFIFMSSMIIYGESAPYGKKRIITEQTEPQPANFYGDSKWQADKGIRELQDGSFNVAVLRPPMIYGKDSKGNYPLLAKLAKKLPIFPDINNERSMLYIDNLCEFLCQIIVSGKAGIFYPQNAEYTKTTELVRLIGRETGHRVWTTKMLNPTVAIGSKMPGKIGRMVNKAFGNMTYDQSMSQYDGMDYQIVDLAESIQRTENSGTNKTIWIIDHYSSEPVYGGISRQYDFARELGKRGYNVIIIASGFCHFTHKYITKEGKDTRISELAPNIHYIYLRTYGYKNNGGIGRARNMFSFMRQVLRYSKDIADKFGEPDVVTGCSVHPLAWEAAYKIAKQYHVRFVAEVRDFWPRIWVVSGDKKKNDPMVIFFDIVQKRAFRRADRIIYSMYHGDKYLCGELKVPKSKVYLIGQPMDCDRFDVNSKKTELLPDDIREFIKGSFVCSFAGYYMTYEGVYVMLEAQKIIEDKGLPIKMVFVGSGQEKEGMERYVAENELKNVMINDRIPKEAVPALISHSQICMAHLEVEGHKEVYKYGVSKNKVNEYLYSGACTMYGFLHKDDEVAESGGGMMFEPYDAEDLANKIEKVYNMQPAERRKYGERGREYIRNTHSVEVLTDQLTKVLFG